MCVTEKEVDPGFGENAEEVASTTTPLAVLLKFKVDAVVLSPVETGSTLSNACEGSERYNGIPTTVGFMKTV